MEHRFAIGDILKRANRGYTGFPINILIIELFRIRGLDYYRFINLDDGKTQRFPSNVVEVDYRKVG